MHQKRGFTLIELLVVIAIIAILATLVVTQLGTARIKARNSTAQADVTEAGKSIEVFKNDDSASDQVIDIGTNGTTYAVLGTSTSQTGVPTGAIDLRTVFAGTSVFTAGSATYPTKYVQTPGLGYTYAYGLIPDTAAAGGSRTSSTNQTMININSGCYIFTTNVKGTTTGAVDTIFYTRGGVTGSHTFASSTAVQLPPMNALSAATGGATVSAGTSTAPYAGTTTPAKSICDL